MIKGANQAKLNLRRKIETIESRLADTVKKIGENVEFVAGLNAPEEIEKTISGVYAKSQTEVSYTVNVAGPPDVPEMAAYLEFGTGVFAANYVKRLPPEWQKIALSFWVNGKGTTKTHSYLYPAFAQQGPKLIDEARKIVK